jgi:hypothetical protein
MTVETTQQPDDLIPIGSRVRVKSLMGSSWNGQVGIVAGYREGSHFRYWVTMPILHPHLKQPITIDGEEQSLPQMFRLDELEILPADVDNA